MPKLLVSVRSVAEAEEALAGGADLIDVKEPSAGSLGRASDETVRAIVERVAGPVPTSAALGELIDWDGTFPEGVDFVKAGLAGLAGKDWRKRADVFRMAARERAVIVAYADSMAAESPLLDELIDYAVGITSPVLLIDTHRKTGSTLFDFVDAEKLATCIARIHGVRGRIALAGSLGRAAAKSSAALQPDWIAVRGAVCEDGRMGTVRQDHVRDFKGRIIGQNRHPWA